MLNTGLEDTGVRAAQSALAASIAGAFGAAGRRLFIRHAAGMVSRIVCQSGMERADGTWVLPSTKDDDFPLAISFDDGTRTWTEVRPVRWADVESARADAARARISDRVLSKMLALAACVVTPETESAVVKSVLALMEAGPRTPSMRWAVISMNGRATVEIVTVDAVQRERAHA